MTTAPKGWIAALLGFVVAPLGMLYARRPGWAVLYLLVPLGFGVIDMVWLRLPEAPRGAVFLTVALIAAWHARRLALQVMVMDGTRPRYSRAPALIAIPVSFLLLVVGIRAFLYEPFRAPSGSMAPTIPSGAFVVVQKWGYGHYDAFDFMLLRRPLSAPIRNADLVVFKRPVPPHFKTIFRVMGVPGDQVEFHERRLHVNNLALEGARVGDYTDQNFGLMHRYAERQGNVQYEILKRPQPTQWQLYPGFPQNQPCTVKGDSWRCTVPPDHYFVLGDNRDNASDSRAWGFVPANHMIGKVIAIFP